jgi:nucleoside-diphosphate-sugar epimerase
MARGAAGAARVAATYGGARAVVTGAAGFLGSHLSHALVDAGIEVVGIDNLITGRRSNLADLGSRSTFSFVEADVTEVIAVAGAVDLVIHLASPASPVDYLRHPIHTLKVGSIGTLHTLGLAKAASARFLLASTSEVYGDPEVHPQPETYRGNVDPVGPRGVYDEAKRFAEAMTYAYHRDHGVDVRVARIFNTYGPGMRSDDGRLVPTLIGQALAGEPLTIHGDGSQTRSLCHVDDLVDGLLCLLASERVAPCNLGSDEEVTVREVAELIRELTGTPAPIVEVERHRHDPQQRQPDLSVARTEVDWEPQVPLREGLQRTIAWCRDAEVSRGTGAR